MNLDPKKTQNKGGYGTTCYPGEKFGKVVELNVEQVQRLQHCRDVRDQRAVRVRLIHIRKCGKITRSICDL